MMDEVADSLGSVLCPTSLVQVHKIPDYYYKEHVNSEPPEALIPEFVKSFEGSYGYVTYYLDELYLFENTERAGWARKTPAGKWEIFVQLVAIDNCHLIEEQCIAYRSFWVRSDEVTLLPFNILIASIFGGHPWEINDHTTTPRDRPFLVAGVEKFELVKSLLASPYEELCERHAAAMRSFGSY